MRTVSLTSMKKTSAADMVFDQLSRNILDGTWPPGSALPAERTIAEGCGCSRIVARQAVHKLADLGLVRNHQGGKTQVLDPSQADSRVALLMVELGIDGWDRELEEQTLLWAIGPLMLAHRRATDAQRAALADIAAHEPAPTLEHRFWEALSAATGNRLFPMDLRFWERAANAPESASEEDRAFYIELAGLLVQRQDPLPFYGSVVGTLL